MQLAQSKRVRLRRLDPKDITEFTAYRGDPAVARFQGWDRMDTNEAMGFLAHMSQVTLLEPGQWTQLGLARRESDLLIGDIGVHMSEDIEDAELGITLASGVQGKGLGFEAVELVCDWLFAQSRISRIVAITHVENERALALLSRTAFVHTHDTREKIEGVAVPERWFERRRS